MRRCLTTALFALALSAPVTALAQDTNGCPPGAWFCEETEVQTPPEIAPAEPPPAALPRPPQRGGAVVIPPPQRGTTVVIPPPPPGHAAPPPIVVYQPVPSGPPPQVVIIAPGYYPAAPGPVRAVPPPAKKVKRVRKWRREFGVNLRLEGAALGSQENGASEDAGMGGMGLSLRYRPVPAFAIDAGVDVLGGIDYNGFDRTEIPVSLSGLLYVNPKSRVQFYFTGGADWSHATVESDEWSPLLENDGGYSGEYSYFGGHGGIGLEFRVARHVGISVDGLAFVRGRTDEGTLPEFMDEHGRTTNTSGGGLFRAGVTFWW